MGKKVLIAAGGTGGHLFPAQGLADALLNGSYEQIGHIDLLFAGAGLGTNPYFSKERYAFMEVVSSTPFTRKLLKRFTSPWILLKGVVQAYKILGDYKPDLIVGFGSFHSFPILLAALWRRIPFVLFESNTVPGKVNRFFSRWAFVTAIQFSATAEKLKGATVEVNMPLWKKKEEIIYSVEEARNYYTLNPHRETLLVFGGSQGALAINQLFLKAAELLKMKSKEFQVIHITGKKADRGQLENFYQEKGIVAHVKEFEEHMSIAWKAASLAICRSGAGTLAEQIFYAVPALLVPYPYGNDDHQLKNAEFMEREIKGGIVFPQSELEPANLSYTIERLLYPHNDDENPLHNMQRSLIEFKCRKDRSELSSLIIQILSA